MYTLPGATIFSDLINKLPNFLEIETHCQTQTEPFHADCPTLFVAL
jgi:hypothetical protein